MTAAMAAQWTAQHRHPSSLLGSTQSPAPAHTTNTPNYSATPKHSFHLIAGTLIRLGFSLSVRRTQEKPREREKKRETEKELETEKEQAAMTSLWFNDSSRQSHSLPQYLCCLIAMATCAPKQRSVREESRE